MASRPSDKNLDSNSGSSAHGGVQRAQSGEKSAAGRKPRAKKAAARIEDLGEKIGGARKDMAEKTGPRKPKGPVDTRPGWMKRFAINEIAASSRPEEKGKFAIYDTRTKDWKGQHRPATRKLFDTRVEAERAVPLLAVSQKHWARPVSGEEYEIWRKVSDRKSVKAVPQKFPSRDAAMEYMAKNAAEILGNAKGFGEEIRVRPEKVYRTGPAYRQGDIDPKRFLKEFGFRGVEFGNWQNERQAVVNHAYDAMRDLAETLGTDPKALTFGNKLALAFGARGNGGKQAALAHYEPAKKVINLTKLSGAGALAHEWWHGFDNELFGRDTAGKTAGFERSYASHSVMASRFKGELPGEVRTAFSDLMNTIENKVIERSVDTAMLERRAQSYQQNLEREIARVRSDLATEQRWGSKTAPASAEQLQRFDQLAAKLLAGSDKPLEHRWNDPTGPNSRNMAGRWTNDTLDAMSQLHKEVRGRAGLGSGKTSGALDSTAQYFSGMRQHMDSVEKAKAQPTETVKVSSDFMSAARKLDQSRGKPYWQTRHEMTARAFESWVYDKIKAQGRASDYLVYGVENNQYASLGEGMHPYPGGAERTAINAKFENLFTAMKQAGVLPGSATPAAAAAAEGAGLRGTQNAANLAAILENRQANVQPEGEAPAKPKNADFNYPGAERYGAGPGAQVRAQARANILNSASGGQGGWEAAQTVEGEWVVRHDGKTPPPAPTEKYVSSYAEPLHEVRNTGNSKRFLVYEDGKAIKDSKGQDKWFSTKERAEAYLEKRRGAAASRAGIDSPAEPKPARAAPAAKAPDAQSLAKAADRLSAAAQRKLEAGEAKLNQDRQTNTARRARMAAGAEGDARRTIGLAKTAMKIAERIKAGDAGPLANVSTMADVEHLHGALRSAMYSAERANKEGYNPSRTPRAEDIQHAKIEYPSVMRRDVDRIAEAVKGQPGMRQALNKLTTFSRDQIPLNSPEMRDAARKLANGLLKSTKTQRDGLAAWEAKRVMDSLKSFDRSEKLGLTNPEGLKAALSSYFELRSGAPAADPIKAAERNLIGMKIPGFFATPESLAKRMADLADIKAGESVLEPSAGSGRLADVAKARGAKVAAVEMSSTLRDLLAKKGHEIIASDFTEMKPEAKFDKILMNPPFEKGQDMAHVQRAYEMLKPGGKMVAIMGEGGFFRTDKQATEFRTWLEGVRGTSEKLPEGTFKESGTGTNTRLVTITKPAGENPGWSDAARAASAEARGAAAPGEAKTGQTVPQDTVSQAGKPAKKPASAAELFGKSMAELKAIAAEHGLAPVRSKQAMIQRITHALGKTVNKAGAVAMVAAPAAAAYVAYQSTRSPAMAADGTVKTGSKAEATANAAIAGGVTAGVGYGVMKAIGGAMKVAAKVAPRIAPALGPVGIVAGVGMMGYGAWQGYKRHGVKGAALGAVGADAILDVKSPAAGPVNGRLSAEQQKQFETANAAFNAMKAQPIAASSGGWSDESRIAAYVARMENAGKTPENMPYGGRKRK